MLITPAVLLQRRPIREHDALLTFYTEGYGKLTVLGRGVSAIGSKLAPHIGEFTVGRIGFIHGRRGDTLTAATVQRRFSAVGADLKRLATGAYILEAYHHWMKEGVSDSSAWKLLLETLEVLNEGREPLRIRWSFPLKFLSLLGWRLPVERYRGGQRLLLQQLMEEDYRALERVEGSNLAALEPMLRSYINHHRSWQSPVEHWGAWATALPLP